MKILIPTDFSDNAQKALNFALTLFGDGQPELHLLNTWQIPHTGVGMLVSIEDILREESEKTMSDLVEDLKKTTRNAFPIVGKVQPGSLPDVVRSVLRTEAYDLVVMGTVGADDVKKKLLGSNTANVVRSSSAPVLVVPMDVKLETPSKVAFATDFKGLTEAQVRPVVDLVKKFNSEFEAVHVESDAEAGTQSLPEGWDRAFGGHAPKVQKVLSEDIAAGIDKYIVDNEVSLLALIRQEYGFFEGLFHKSVSRKLSMHASCPLLIIPGLK